MLLREIDGKGLYPIVSPDVWRQIGESQAVMDVVIARFLSIARFGGKKQEKMTIPPNAPTCLTPLKEISELTGISVSTMLRWCHKGRITAEKREVARKFHTFLTFHAYVHEVVAYRNQSYTPAVARSHAARRKTMIERGAWDEQKSV